MKKKWNHHLASVLAEVWWWRTGFTPENEGLEQKNITPLEIRTIIFKKKSPWLWVPCTKKRHCCEKKCPLKKGMVKVVGDPKVGLVTLNPLNHLVSKCFLFYISRIFQLSIWPYGGFLKWWYRTTMGFPTKNDHFRVFGGLPPFKETPIYLEPCHPWDWYIRIWIGFPNWWLPPFHVQDVKKSQPHTIHGTNGIYVPIYMNGWFLG